MHRKHGVLIAVVGLAVAFGASGTLMAGPDSSAVYTVGELALRLATELRLDVPGEGAEVASAVLASAGVTISGDLTRELRERDVAEILNQLGLQLTTSNPDRAVGDAKVELLLGLVVVAPGTEGSGGASASDRGNNPPGGGFGRSKGQASPHTP